MLEGPDLPVESPAVISAEHAIQKSTLLDAIVETGPVSWESMRRRVVSIQIMIAVCILLVITLAWTIQTVAHNRARLDTVTALADRLQAVAVTNCHADNQIRTDIAELAHAALPIEPPPNATPEQVARRLHLQELIFRVSTERDCTQLVEGTDP